MKYLWKARSAVLTKLGSKRRKLLLLDFDGTLAPISKNPKDVRMDAQTASLIRRLSKNSDFQVAVVSGRALAEIYSFLRIKEAWYVGNHGLEMKGKNLRLPFLAKKARKMAPLIRRLGKKMKAEFCDLAGTLVEDKKYTLSLHFRNLKKKSHRLFAKRLARFRKAHARWPLLWYPGKKVIEIRPGVSWNKGDAARYLCKKIPNVLPVAVGDDVTDEDMFRAVRGTGITVRVGFSSRSCAEYYFKSPEDVRLFLRWCLSERYLANA